MSAIKPFTDIFTRTGALRYFALASGVHALTSSAETVMTAGETAHHQDPNGWEKTGFAAGETVGAGVQFGVDMATMRYFGVREGGAEASLIARTKLGKYVQSGTAITKPGMFNRGSRIYKNMGFLKGGLAIGGAIAFQMAAPAVLGFAGRVMDEASADLRRQREIHYDSRYFNTDKYDMSTFKQVGAAMDTYQNKMLSLARIYHAR